MTNHVPLKVKQFVDDPMHIAHIGSTTKSHFGCLPYFIFDFFYLLAQNDIYLKFYISVEIWVESSNPGKFCVHNDSVISQPWHHQVLL